MLGLEIFCIFLKIKEAWIWIWTWNRYGHEIWYFQKNEDIVTVMTQKKNINIYCSIINIISFSSTDALLEVSIITLLVSSHDKGGLWSVCASQRKTLSQNYDINQKLNLAGASPTERRVIWSLRYMTKYVRIVRLSPISSAPYQHLDVVSNEWEFPYLNEHVRLEVSVRPACLISSPEPVDCPVNWTGLVQTKLCSSKLCPFDY